MIFFMFVQRVIFLSVWCVCVCPEPLPSPGHLQETTVRVMDQSTCAKRCTLAFNSNMICAGSSSGSHGEGDSGGPVVNRLCSLWVQSGVKSTILGCALPDLLGVYTRVSEYQQWITGVIKENLPGFVLFNPPDQCSPASKGSDSCHGRCNEKYNAGFACNCNADCNTDCCSDYKKRCDE
ncbi:tryptase-like [Megalobrama amblycephala]|uniref:tryptase-like n=1 Tax=Megalobrama amblycephala TaxID=75352 RepID=UPI002013F5A3|nr:tryptase-like [Megalobrama amblycephala]